MSLQPHVDRHALLSFEKQLHAYDVIGEASWWVDLDAGTIVFAGELEMSAGLLGTEAGGTFLWGWANPGSFPEPVIAAGRELGLPELRAPEHALSDDISLERIGMIASGVLGLDATYTGPLDEDARMLLALRDPRLALPAPDDVRLVTVLTAVVEAGFVADWPAALRAYAGQRGLPHQERGAAHTLAGVTVALDAHGGVAEISA